MSNPKMTNNKDSLRWQLGERVKELTALHRTALILNNPGSSIARTMQRLVDILPKAWQFPEITGAKITWVGKTFVSGGYKRTKWRQRADFKIGAGQTGSIEICYLRARPRSYQGPFLKEEVLLLNSLAVMLRTYLQNVIYQEQQSKAKLFLKLQIKKRTSDLAQSNTDLRRELALRRRRERQIKAYQEQLKNLARKLSTTEERERREIATDLHDHIGQGLAMINVKLQALYGNSVFSGQESQIEEIKALTRQVIKYTRNLTFELCPLVVYELDFGAALQWLADHFKQKYGLQVAIRNNGKPRPLTDDARIMLFKSVRELLMNSVKHGRANRADIDVKWPPEGLEIMVRDNGSGFDPQKRDQESDLKGFGLFSIKERIDQYGGKLTFKSRPGMGCEVTFSLAAKAGDKG